MTGGPIGAAGIRVVIAGKDVSKYVDECHIHHDIQKISGDGCQISLVDPEGFSETIDGSYDQDVLVDVIAEDGRKNSYKFKLYEGSNVSGEEKDNQGGGHYKRITLKCVNAAERNVHANYAKFTKEDSVTNLMKKTLEDCYKVEEPIEIDDPSEGKRFFSGSNKHGNKFMDELQNEAVSQKNKGSTYCAFLQQNEGRSVRKITTYEQCFSQQPVTDLTYTTKNEKGKTNILNYDVDTNFTTAADHGKKAVEATFNTTTHGVSYTKEKETKFVLPGKEINSQGNPKHKEYPVYSVTDKKNESAPNKSSTAKVDRAKFLKNLCENSAQCQITFDPSIGVGKMVNFNVPSRKGDNSGSGDNPDPQFAGPVLVTSYTTSIVQADKAFRVTQNLSLAKASFNA